VQYFAHQASFSLHLTIKALPLASGSDYYGPQWTFTT